MVEREMTLRKLKRRMEELEELRFVGMESLFPFQALEDGESVDFIHRAVPEENFPLAIEEKDRFHGRDRYLWLRKTVQLPRGGQGLAPVGFFDFGKTDGGHNSGFESLLYLDREPYQGVDSNHKEVVFTGLEGRECELTFMLWTGLEGGGPKRDQEHCLRHARLGCLHLDTDELYYFFRAITETLDYLAETDPAREGLIGAAEACLRVIDWDRACFYDTVSPALNLLRERLAAMPKDTRLTTICVGHTHIDVAWLWRLKHTREKAMRSFASVLHFMDEFPGYQFFQSQPQLYKYLQQDHPALFEKVKARIAEGRWEPDGGMWLEADCNISSGEALSRQFLYGMGYFQREFGKRSTILWLPDVFGYSWALPQIMRQCGIETFVTTKISWNQFNTMPNDLFQWRGIDGSQVLTYFVETPDIGKDFAERGSTYNGRLAPRSVLGAWHKFRNKELTGDTLIAYGYGDGGGGPNRDMMRLRQVMDTLPGLPAVKDGSAGAFFRGLHRAVETTDRPVHTWDGELYLEYHRGTYTSQAANKRWNRVLENELAELEMLAVLTGLPYPRQTIDNGWETVLLLQFHDIIPGSSIREVYEDSDIQYQDTADSLALERQKALTALVKPEADAFTLFSSASFGRRDTLFFPVEGSGRFVLDGVTLPAQKRQGGYNVLVETAPLTPAVVRFVPGEEVSLSDAFSFDGKAGTVESPHYRIAWDAQGSLTGIYDKENRRQVLAENGFGNHLIFFEDKPLDYENWDVDFFVGEKFDFATLDRAPELVQRDGLTCRVRFAFTYRNSHIAQEMVLYRESRRIDFETTVDWHEERRLLKACFDTSVRTTKATYDIQYGFAERPTHRNTSWDVARFEVVGHKWADLSETGYGVSLLNDCKYGYSAENGQLALTLLKSGKFPDTEADMGTHRFTYALLPHKGGVAESETIAEATALNLPVRRTTGAAASTQPLLRWDSDAVVIDAVKQAEDGQGMVVRLHECRGGSCAVRLATSLAVRAVQPCNILEEPQGEPVSPENWIAELRPFQIKNFRLIL